MVMQNIMTMKLCPAIASITPVHRVPLSGRGGLPRMFEEGGDQLEANAVALAKENGHVVIIALDTLFASDALHDAVKQMLGSALGENDIDLILVASHTHNAPSLDPTKPGLGEMDQTYFTYCAEQIATCAANAITTANKAKPANISHGKSSCALNAVRRKKAVRLSSHAPFIHYGTQLLPNRSTATPHGLDIIIAYDANKNPLWAIWSWACHATSFPYGNVISPDFPGPVRDSLRRQLGCPDLPVIYLPGFAGDIRSDAMRSPVPLRKRLASPFSRPFADCTPENFDFLCAGLSVAIKDALNNMAELGPLKANAHIVSDSIAFDELMETPRSGNISLVQLTAAPLNFFFMGAETCSPYRALFAPHLPLDTVMSGYAGDVPLYLPVDSQIAEGGYEVDGFRHSFGLPGHYFDRIEHILTARVIALATRHS